MNLDIYNKVREVPKTAQKEIQGGRLKGMTDINPMWRIKVLTETFGPVGIGWYYDITDKRLDKTDSGEVAAFVDVLLYYKHEGEWSKGVAGTGGSAFVAKEKNGLYVSDECFKMALTDALSVACKAIGIGADVYWAKDNTKYTNAKIESDKPTPTDPKITPEQAEQIVILADAHTVTLKQVMDAYKLKALEDMTVPMMQNFVQRMEKLDAKAKQESEANKG